MNSGNNYTYYVSGDTGLFGRLKIRVFMCEEMKNQRIEDTESEDWLFEDLRITKSKE